MSVDLGLLGKECGEPAAQPVVFTCRRPDELVAMQFDDSDNLMGDRVLCKGGRTVMIGQGGIGKSFLLLQLAAAHITGRDFLCFKTRGSGLRWLIFQAENDNRRLRFDMLRLKKWVGDSDWPLVCENLVIHTLEIEADFWLHIATDPAAFGRACEAVRRFHPHVIGFDPLKDLTTGDLNKDMDMRIVCDSMNAIARTDGNTERVVCTLHHSLTGLQGAEKAVGMDRASFGRNSKVLHAWARSVINVVPANEENSQLIVSSGKNNNGAEFKPFAVRREPEQLIFEYDPGFDMEHWISSRGKGTREKPQPNHDQVLSLFRHDASKPRACLLTAVELRAAFRRHGWEDSWAPALRDELESAGKLKVYRGPHNVKLVGLPEMVDAFAELEKSRGTLLEQAALAGRPTPKQGGTPNRKRRKP